MISREAGVSLLAVPDTHTLGGWFVAPPDFERMIGDNSVIVFGGAGSGKTTLTQALAHFGGDIDGKGKRLIVRWKPALFATEADSLSSANRLIDQALDACALELSAYLASHPDKFKSAPNWVRTGVCWFIQKNLRGNKGARLAKLFDGADQSQLLVDQLLAQVEDVLFNPDPIQKIEELIPALKRLGLNGIWFCTDGMEGWIDTKQEQLVKDLAAFLSALNIFEQPGLVFKLFLPLELEHHIIRASGVVRRRVDGCHLQWDNQHLQGLAERRLAFISGKKQFPLKSLCSSPGLIPWLDRVGGGSPREWLDQLEPLFTHYSSERLTKPVTEGEWRELRSKYPPHFWMDETGRNVRVGGREIPLDDVPPKAFEILRYLYAHGGQVVGKAELYYFIYKGLASVPRSLEEKSYESPSEYTGVIDTSIYRLRQAIEPDPSHPVIIQTIRGHGYKLVSRW